VQGDPLGGAVGGSRSSDPAAVGRVKGFVTELWGLGEDETVMVAELRCSEPGCPPVETSISALGESGTRQRKVHKPVAEVTREDVARLAESAAERE